MRAKGVQIAVLATVMVVAGWFGYTNGGVQAVSAESPAVTAATTANVQNTVTVGAEGSIKVEPDVAYLNFAVEARGATAQAAQQEAAKRFSAVEKTLYETFKLDRKDVKTTSFSVQPEYTYTEKEGQKLKDYLASHQVQVTYRDLDNIGKLLDAVSAAGANRMDGVQFGTEKEEQYQLEALKKAMANADAKANVLAVSAKRQLGQVINIVQGEAASVPIIRQNALFAKEMASAAADAGSSIQTGQIEIAANVTVQYEMK
ncbi:SIMPL domain-containing protein [Cohnella nanjingensis]|uniref:SIMPL domain-containing protein n=1 Tax=Cohnella nanjingensis TaxID=1387779 RepID=A0A7X0RTB6_9BACL|nr:SIMPL domain-containing protein [Cohnella nanjingensis]MBB6673138.1 SIMPL domain-containing protein [Cohnella nanjingensis]